MFREQGECYTPTILCFQKKYSKKTSFAVANKLFLKFLVKMLDLLIKKMLRIATVTYVVCACSPMSGATYFCICKDLLLAGT
jgi:hypothetical protein